MSGRVSFSHTPPHFAKSLLVRSFVRWSRDSSHRAFCSSAAFANSISYVTGNWIYILRAGAQRFLLPQIDRGLNEVRSQCRCVSSLSTTGLIHNPQPQHPTSIVITVDVADHLASQHLHFNSIRMISARLSPPVPSWYNPSWLFVSNQFSVNSN